MNILRLALLGLAALAGIVAVAAFLQKALRPETSSASLTATASLIQAIVGTAPWLKAASNKDVSDPAP